MKFEFRFESLKSKFSLILSVNKLMVAYPSKQQRKLSEKMLLNNRKRNRVKFNPGLSANRPLYNWVQVEERQNGVKFLV